MAREITFTAYFIPKGTERHSASHYSEHGSSFEMSMPPEKEEETLAATTETGAIAEARRVAEETGRVLDEVKKTVIIFTAEPTDVETKEIYT